MSTTPREHLTYTAHTAQQEGVIFEHYGTVEGAARKATSYAHSAFPAWEYRGYGPTIIVARSNGERIVEERL